MMRPLLVDIWFLYDLQIIIVVGHWLIIATLQKLFHRVVSFNWTTLVVLAFMRIDLNRVLLLAELAVRLRLVLMLTDRLLLFLHHAVRLKRAIFEQLLPEPLIDLKCGLFLQHCLADWRQVTLLHLNIGYLLRPSILDLGVTSDTVLFHGSDDLLCNLLVQLLLVLLYLVFHLDE